MDLGFWGFALFGTIAVIPPLVAAFTSIRRDNRQRVEHERDLMIWKSEQQSWKDIHQKCHDEMAKDITEQKVLTQENGVKISEVKETLSHIEGIIIGEKR